MRLAILLLSFASFLTLAEDAAEVRAKGVAALKESQSNPRAIVDAARHFAKAAELFSAAGNEEKVVEMNSFLYWCRKKMTLDDVEAFAAGGEAPVVEKLNRVEKLAPKVDEAEEWLARAEKFAAANPSEHLLTAVRFFEVADRFKGTGTSLAAMDRCLKAQLLVQEKSGLPKFAAPANAPLPQTGLAPPDVAEQRKAAQKLRETFKGEFAGKEPSIRTALVKKLIQLADETTDDAAMKYAACREAADLAFNAGDGAGGLAAIDVLAGAFRLDRFDEFNAALKRAATAAENEEALWLLVKFTLKTGDDAAQAAQFNRLKALASSAEALLTRMKSQVTGNLSLRAKLAKFKEMAAAWPAVEAAQAALANNPEDPKANDVAGSFYCFIAEDWTRGLPALARSANPVLKAAAQKDLASSQSAAGFSEAAESWLAYRTKAPPSQRPALETHMLHLYEQAVQKLAGLEKAKAEKQLQELQSLRPRPIPKLEILKATFIPEKAALIDLTEQYRRAFDGDPYAFLYAGNPEGHLPRGEVLEAEVRIDGKVQQLRLTANQVYIPKWWQGGTSTANLDYTTLAAADYRIVSARVCGYNGNKDITAIIAERAKSPETSVSFHKEGWGDVAPFITVKNIVVVFDRQGKRYMRKFAENDKKPIVQ